MRLRSQTDEKKSEFAHVYVFTGKVVVETIVIGTYYDAMIFYSELI